MKKLVLLVSIILSIFLFADSGLAASYYNADIKLYGTEYSDISGLNSGTGPYGWLVDGTAIYTKWSP